MDRYTFWLWLLLLFAIWTGGLIYPLATLVSISASQWLGSALFFSIYFVIPVFRNNQFLQAVMLAIASVIVMLVFWPNEGQASHYYVLLLYAYLAGEATFRLQAKFALVDGVVIIGCLLMPFFFGTNVLPISFLIMCITMLFLALWKFHGFFHQLIEAEARYETLLHEYRSLKRRSISDERLVRQQERTQIGRDIHDSVGHKLTTLLMQLEVARLEGQASKEKLELLKELAKDSLEETRTAVKTLKQEEIGGIPAIISLIKKLEAENFLRIHFSVKNRVFSAPLHGEQMVAVYRAVQEALTNVMRHSPVREATVLFESPGESVFRFEVSNPIETNYAYKDGYGLTAMRERIEQAGGTLQVLVYQRTFVIRGIFPLYKGKELIDDDSDPVS